MKHLSLLLPVLLARAGMVQAQGLEGTFTSAQKGKVSFFSEAFRFRGNQFDYQFSGCTEAGQGQGHYTVQGDTLRLYFEPSAPTGTVRAMACTSASPLFPGAPDTHSTRFCFTVTDAESRKPLDGITICSQRQPLRATQTNDAGEAVLTFEPEPADSIVVGGPEGRRMTIAIGHAAGQGFEVALPKAYTVQAGTIYTYVLGKRTVKAGVITFTGTPTPIGPVYTRVPAEELRRYPIF